MSIAPSPRKHRITPLDWQRMALDSIHVYDIDNASTCVFLDSNGARLKDHRDYAACLPIEFFDPQAESQLLDYLDGLPKVRELGPKRIHTTIIDPIRTGLQKQRPHGYAFRKTKEELLQIHRIFVELNKYSAISADLFENSDLLVLVGRDNADITTISAKNNLKKAAGGYFNENDNVAAICIQNDFPEHKTTADRTLLRSKVAEEILHAADYKSRRELSKDMSPEFMQVLAEYADRLEHLSLKWQQNGMDRANVTFSPEERKLMDRLVALSEAHIQAARRTGHPYAAIPNLAFQDRHYHAIDLLDRVIGFLRNGSQFKELELYSDQPEDNDRYECFAKLGKQILLIRHRNRHVDHELGKSIEEVFYSPYGDERDKTTPFANILKYFDKTDKEYGGRYSEEERQRGREFAENIARGVEKRLPSSTHFIFTKGTYQSR